LIELVFVKDITCDNSLDCSNLVLGKIEAHTNLILLPRQQDGIHHGFLQIHHKQREHLIRIFIYEKTDNKIFVRRPSTMPDRISLSAKLNEIP